MKAPVRAAAPSRGMTLFETTVVVLVLGALLVPLAARFTLALEQTRVDNAGAGLLTIWHAQRMHHLEEGAFADDLAELEIRRLVDEALGLQATPFTYDIVFGDADGFSATAVRAGSTRWSGTLSIDETGALTGTISDGGGTDVSPSQG